MQCLDPEDITEDLEDITEDPEDITEDLEDITEDPEDIMEDTDRLWAVGCITVHQWVEECGTVRLVAAAAAGAFSL